MSIELISELVPKNKANFAIADVNNLRGGYILVNTLLEMDAFLDFKDKLKEGMLCYVKESPTNDHMYQYLGGAWRLWAGQGGSGGSGGASILVVDTLEDLNRPEYQITGQIVFVNEIDSIRFYNGDYWESFSRIYIQDVPPTDLGGIWIDTSENKEHLESNTIIQSLLKIIGVLQNKVEKMEYAFNNVMDFGDFSNNNYHTFRDAPGIEPSYGTSEQEDLEQQEINKLLELADSPEPVEYKEFSANCRHLQIKSGTQKEMDKNKSDFAPSELLYCYDTKTLWIKDPKTYQLVQIGKVGVGPNPEIPDYMEGIITQDKKIAGIQFVDMVDPNKSFLVEVRNGELELYDEALDSVNLPDVNTLVETGLTGVYSTAYEPKPSESDPTKLNPRFYINMVYCGGNSSDTYSPCNYNFVELSNTTNYDINLKGIYLHYTEGPVDAFGNRYWITLPLKGTIKSKSTFLIRGAKCGEDKFALVQVGKPDIYWTKLATISNTLLDTEGEYSVWDTEGYLKMDHNCALYLSGEPKDGTYSNSDYALNIPSPYIKDGSAYKGVIYGYIDLVGFGSDSNGLAMPNEGTVMGTASNDRIMMKYYSLDDMSQAYKGLNKRANAKDWTYIDLINTYPEIDLYKYTPKNSKLKKNIFFNKNLLTEGPPCFVNVTFGYNAHKTRCFTWVSKGYSDEFLQYRKLGESLWTTIESFKKGDNRSSNNKNWDNDIYNRIRSFTTDGTYFTSHKCIVDLLEPLDKQTYEYRVGAEGRWTNIKTFTLRNRLRVIESGFTFVQVTDLQGFNLEEYKTWGLAAEYIDKIDKENFDFILNTGDATLSGNRVNEWVDYFRNGLCLTDKYEQMFTVGNNDLCPVILYVLGDGRDLAKHNPINAEYFFTFEHPYEILKSSEGVYIPCVYDFIYGDTYFLSVNSEITTVAISEIFKHLGSNIYSELMKGWCIRLLTHLDESIKWRIAYCHEAPFTIITNAVIELYMAGTAESNLRGGSKLNSVGEYFFSKFLQDNNFDLCICGHKHTYANSRYIREPQNADGNTFAIDVYDPEGESAAWYLALNESGTDYRKLVNISNDTSKHYVKYVMCQATGYKLTSNKELPGRHLPYLLEYYKVTPALKVNPGLLYPNYIVWNIGKGRETETEFLVNYDSAELEIQEPPIPTLKEARPRILGHSKKLWDSKRGTIKDSANWNFKYNAPLNLSDIKACGGNGESANNGRNNIIVEKLS